MEKFYKNKRVLITGHTGFKGSWLATWLTKFGAQVIGVSDRVPTNPSHFEVAKVKRFVSDIRCDIRDFERLNKIIKEQKPEIIFHLAAQSLVRESLRDPIRTYSTNVMGTVHMLQAIREMDSPCVAVFVTSDKSYENREWLWGYREDDRLGGSDPYSASKGAAEFAIRAHVKSMFNQCPSEVRIGVGRAGNVIGGGDWSAGRIVPDCVTSWAKNKEVELRNSQSTRPWQHVLEPLSGYLYLASQLEKNSALHGEPFNFGPPNQQDHTVMELVREMSAQWGQADWKIVDSDKDSHEAHLLKLNCDKADRSLGWRAVLSFKEAVDMTIAWYRNHYTAPDFSPDFTGKQISKYTELAKERSLPWATNI